MHKLTIEDVSFKGKTVFVHLLSWNGQTVTLPNIPRKIVASRNGTASRATATIISMREKPSTLW